MKNENLQLDMDLYEKLDQKLELWGASKWGIADLTSAEAQMTAEYGSTWQEYPRAVSVAVYFPKQVIQQLADAPTLTYQAYYDIVCARLNDISLRTCLMLEDAGYKAFPVPASQRVGKFKEAGIFSHRTAAHLAGLGWVGKSLSLITEEVGPRLRLCTIFTDAPLPTGTPLTKTCPPNCKLCFEACPSGAILGVPYSDQQNIEDRFIRQNCADYLRQVRQSFGKEICGKCLAACPYGR